LVFSGILPACRSTTYKKETIKESIQQLAQKEVGMNVRVEEVGDVLGVQVLVPNLRGELTSGDDWISKKVQGLLMILMRVVMSIDAPPAFVVLSVVDQSDPNFGFLFTRYAEDVRRAWSDAISRGQVMDRLLDEYVVGSRTIPMDPEEADALIYLIMSLDTREEAPLRDFRDVLKEVDLPRFLAKAGANTLRRRLRENKKMLGAAALREVKGSYFTAPEAGFEFVLDIMSPSHQPVPEAVLTKDIFPFAEGLVKDLMKIYRFDAFSHIRLVEKNTGQEFLLRGKR